MQILIGKQGWHRGNQKTIAADFLDGKPQAFQFLHVTSQCPRVSWRQIYGQRDKQSLGWCLGLSQAFEHALKDDAFMGSTDIEHDQTILAFSQNQRPSQTPYRCERLELSTSGTTRLRAYRQSSRRPG